MDLAELRPNPRNPNRHPDEQIKLLAKIIETQGWRQPVKVSTRSGMIVSGHGRYQAAQLLRCPVPVDFQDYESEEEELADLTADNRIAELAENDEEMLAEILAEINLSDLSIEMTGYTDEDLDSIIGSIIGEDDEEPEPPYQDEEYQQLLPPMSKPGDIWQLGRHRLICGDSTDNETVAKLLNGEKADMVFTDPPYGYQYQSNMRENTQKFDVIINDDKILDFMPAMKPHIDGFVFVCTTWKTLDKWLPLFKKYFDFTNMIIWDKGGGGIGDLKKTFSTDYEIILCSNNGHELTGKRIGSVWDINKDNPNIYVHPTQKPVALIEQAINSTTVPGDNVLDLFGGSGSTMIACERKDRNGYLMELEPKYCDVIISRYVIHTSNLGVTCIRDGKEIPYMDLVSAWAKTAGEEERINSMKIPVVVTKKIAEAAVSPQDEL